MPLSCSKVERDEKSTHLWRIRTDGELLCHHGTEQTEKRLPQAKHQMWSREHRKEE